MGAACNVLPMCYPKQCNVLPMCYPKQASEDRLTSGFWGYLRIRLSRAPDARDEDHRRLQAKIGELLMETELLYAKVDQLEAGGPLARRRSTR